MRLSLLPVLLTGVGLIATQVAAEPLRLVDTTANANIRFGHVIANANVNGNDDSITRHRPPIILPLSAEVKGIDATRHWCKGALREKAIRISNAFRHALGLPLIEIDLPAIGVTHHAEVISTGPEEVHILPVPISPFLGTITEFADGHHATQPEELFGSSQPEEVADRPHHKEHHGKHKKFHKKCRKGVKGFFKRIHRAMMTLGPWEARAVAFVLGCGIGVLLRLFWVLTVLAYRTVRGEPDDIAVHDEYIVFDPHRETVFVAPPGYSDEKRHMDGVPATQIDV